MIIVKPITITDAALISSSVAEDDHAAWVAETTYSPGAKVIRTATHRRYEALATTTGDTPESSPDQWLDLGATNRWAMFDDSLFTQTTHTTGALELELQLGAAWDSIAIFNAQAGSVRVQVHDASGELALHDETYVLSPTISEPSWHQWFFTTREYRPERFIQGIQAYGSSVATLTFAPSLGGVSIGMLAIGRARGIGATLYGIELGIMDFSVKTRDEFGRQRLVERNYADTMRLDVVVEKARFAQLKRELAALRAQPCVYVEPAEIATLLYGWYNDFTMAIPEHNHYRIALNLEGFA